MALFPLILAILVFAACEDNKPDNFGRKDYDPSKPVRIDSFEPDSGGLATKVFITGNNFGSDLSKIKVYFNNLRAPVVGSDGDHLYVITPRKPGREVTLSVVVEGDSVPFTDKKYLYRIMATVTTIAGKPGTTAFTAGTLSEATFEWPMGMCIDDNDNLFISHWRNPYCFIRLNEEADIVSAVHPGSLIGPDDAMGFPAIEVNNRILVPNDQSFDYAYFDPATEWLIRRRTILQPTQELIDQGWESIPPIAWSKQSFAYCEYDGFMYTYSFSGNLIKFDPATRYGCFIRSVYPNSHGIMCFDPYKPHIMYLNMQTANVIYTYDVITGEMELFAGTLGRAGYRDGPRLEAEFNYMQQMIVDTDGSLVVTDARNHCIRRIDQDGMVSTVIGKGTVSGWEDGNADDALFTSPWGIAISKDGAIYVSCLDGTIRKLAIE